LPLGSDGVQSFSTLLSFLKNTECPGSDEFQNLLEDLLEEDAVEHVACKHWISTDRSTLETNVKQSAEFTSMLILRDSIGI
jgi:hypothetical protein